MVKKYIEVNKGKMGMSGCLFSFKWMVQDLKCL